MPAVNRCLAWLHAGVNLADVYRQEVTGVVLGDEPGARHRRGVGGVLAVALVEECDATIEHKAREQQQRNDATGNDTRV